MVHFAVLFQETAFSLPQLADGVETEADANNHAEEDTMVRIIIMGFSFPCLSRYIALRATEYFVPSLKMFPISIAHCTLISALH